MSPPWPLWLFELASWTLVAIGLPLLLWALFGNRPRGRRRCDRCWYDLAGLPLPASTRDPSAACPECGRVIRTASQTRRTRRRWVAATLAFAMLAASGPLARLPWALGRSWIGAVPSTALVAWEALWGGACTARNCAVRKELMERLQFRDVGLLSSAAGALLRNDLIVTRDVWPVGVPIMVFTNVVRHEGVWLWLASPRPPLESFERVWEPPQRLTPPPAGTRLLEARLPSGQRVARRIEVRGRVDDIIIPIASPGLDAEVLRALAPVIVLMPLSDRVALSMSWPERMIARESAAVGLRVTVRRDGAVAGEAPWLAMYASPPSLLVGDDQLLGLLAQAVRTGESAELARWTVRLEGDGALALADLRAKRYWAGSVTMCAADLLGPSPAGGRSPSPAPR